MNSIVFVNFECNESTKVVAQKIWQWNYGQILRIQGLNLPAAVEIHFSLQKTGGIAERRIGVTRDGVTDVVIPDFILTGEGIERNYSAYAFIYLSDEESGQTEHRIELNITSRPEPEGSSKEDDTSFGAIMDAVNKIAEQNGQGVSDEKIAEAVNAYMEANPVEGNVTVDTDLSETSTNPVQNKVVTAKFSQLSDTVNDKANQTEMNEVKDQLKDISASETTGISAELTTAFRRYFTNVQTLLTQLVYVTESNLGNTVIQNASDIVTVLGGEELPDEPIIPDATLSSISATYTGDSVTVGTALTDLTGITVTAHYSDGSTSNVTGYTLSGEILEGENTITVSYGGKATTFTVMGVTESSGDDNEETTPLRGLQLEAFPTSCSDTDFWDYSNYGSDLANAYGGGNQIKFAYKPKLFTGTIYLRMINALGYDHLYTTMGDIYLTDNADFFSNVASETLEKLTAEELTRQFTVDGVTGLVHVSDDGITRPTNAYNNGGYEKTGSNGYVYLQKFVIPEGKYGVLTISGTVGVTNTNVSYREGWSTVFYDNPTDNITCTEVTE